MLEQVSPLGRVGWVPENALSSRLFEPDKGLRGVSELVVGLGLRAVPSHPILGGSHAYLSSFVRRQKPKDYFRQLERGSLWLFSDPLGGSTWS